jgi:hypothetical protein
MYIYHVTCFDLSLWRRVQVHNAVMTLCCFAFDLWVAIRTYRIRRDQNLIQSYVQENPWYLVAWTRVKKLSKVGKVAYLVCVCVRACVRVCVRSRWAAGCLHARTRARTQAGTQSDRNIRTHANTSTHRLTCTHEAYTQCL